MLCEKMKGSCFLTRLKKKVFWWIPRL